MLRYLTVSGRKVWLNPRRVVAVEKDGTLEGCQVVTNCGVTYYLTERPEVVAGDVARQLGLPGPDDPLQPPPPSLG